MMHKAYNCQKPHFHTTVSNTLIFLKQGIVRIFEKFNFLEVGTYLSKTVFLKQCLYFKCNSFYLLNQQRVNFWQNLKNCFEAISRFIKGSKI